MQDAERVVEVVARSSYGRLVAFLASESGDVAGAEDALGEALLAALSTWPHGGIPDQPEAWLLTTARHRLVDHARRAQVHAKHADALLRRAEEAETAMEQVSDDIPDRRLELLFVCAHPAIDPSMHTPLMLQTALGLDAARIAQAFLVAPATMGQRLVRAKTKIREARIPFSIPAEGEWPSRLEAVTEAIYAAFGLAWDATSGADARAQELTEEALWLARLLVRLMPNEPEPRGLLALMLFCESRRAARRTSDGRYVPLSEQDPSVWSTERIREAEAELRAAAALSRPGRFQLEAAIQSVHAERRTTGRTEWKAIAAFYEHLVNLAPTLGSRISRCAAAAEASGPAAGLALLDAIEPDAVATYQPYWAVRAHLLRAFGRTAEAAAAFERAIGLTEDEAVRRFLLERRG